MLAELLGFGTLAIRFVISHSVDDPKQANAKLVTSLLPAFRPSFTLHNGKRIYNLISDKITLVRYNDIIEEEETPDNSTKPDDPTPGGGDDGGTGGDGGDDFV